MPELAPRNLAGHDQVEDVSCSSPELARHGLKALMVSTFGDAASGRVADRLIGQKGLPRDSYYDDDTGWAQVRCARSEVLSNFR